MNTSMTGYEIFFFRSIHCIRSTYVHIIYNIYLYLYIYVYVCDIGFVTNLSIQIIFHTENVVFGQFTEFILGKQRQHDKSFLLLPPPKKTQPKTKATSKFSVLQIQYISRINNFYIVSHHKSNSAGEVFLTFTHIFLVFCLYLYVYSQPFF